MPRALHAYIALPPDVLRRMVLRRAYKQEREDDEASDEIYNTIWRTGCISTLPGVPRLNNKTPDTIVRACTGVAIKYFKPPYFRTPYDYFLQKREDMSTSTSFEQILRDQLTGIEDRLAELKTEQIRVRNALKAYREPTTKTQPTTSKATKPAKSAAETVNRALGDAGGTTTKKPRAPRTAKSRERMDQAALERRDHLQTLLMVVAEDPTHPGEVTQPEVARLAGYEYASGGPSAELPGKGSRRSELSDAFLELVEQGKLIKTEERVFPTDDRKRPRSGGRHAVLYRLATPRESKDKESSQAGAVS